MSLQAGARPASEVGARNVVPESFVFASNSTCSDKIPHLETIELNLWQESWRSTWRDLAYRTSLKKLYVRVLEEKI